MAPIVEHRRTHNCGSRDALSPAERFEACLRAVEWRNNPRRSECDWMCLRIARAAVHGNLLLLGSPFAAEHEEELLLLGEGDPSVAELTNEIAASIYEARADIGPDSPPWRGAEAPIRDEVVVQAVAALEAVWRVLGVPGDLGRVG